VYLPQKSLAEIFVGLNYLSTSGVAFCCFRDFYFQTSHWKGGDGFLDRFLIFIPIDL
jgi:hypothetical protein